MSDSVKSATGKPAAPAAHEAELRRRRLPYPAGRGQRQGQGQAQAAEEGFQGLPLLLDVSMISNLCVLGVARVCVLVVG